MGTSQSSSAVSSWSAGQVIMGSVLSSSVTRRVQVEVLPLSSVAVMVTVCVVPSPLRSVPGAGSCVRVMAAGSEQLSEGWAAAV